jgi:hypothetical protein
MAPPAERRVLAALSHSAYVPAGAEDQVRPRRRPAGTHARNDLSAGLIYAVLVGVLLTVGLGAITILIIAVALLSMQFFTSDKIAPATIGAKEVTSAQAPELHGLVDRLCVQANIPKPRRGADRRGLLRAADRESVGHRHLDDRH